MVDERSTSALDARVARAESEIEAVSQQVGQVARSVERLTESVDRGFKEVYSLAREQGKPPWTQLIGGAGLAITLILSVVGLWLSGYNRDRDRMEVGLLRQIESTKAELNKLEQLNFRTFEQAIRNDEYLHREAVYGNSRSSKSNP